MLKRPTFANGGICFRGSVMLGAKQLRLLNRGGKSLMIWGRMGEWEIMSIEPKIGQEKQRHRKPVSYAWVFTMALYGETGRCVDMVKRQRRDPSNHWF